MIINNNVILIFILVILIINSFLIGYIFGRSSATNGVSSVRTQSFFKQKDNQTKEIISIDDKKFVVDIKTEGLEKKYDSLGDIKQTQENISESVNKLKNLKR